MRLLDVLLDRIARSAGPVRPSTARSRQLGYIFVGARRALLGGSGKFTPIKTFAATGANGAWLDESDFSTLFQDSAGTTPVTAVEQPIGLMKDKSGRTNNVLQAAAVSRPVVSALVNSLVKTENLLDAAWTNLTTTVVAGISDPNGGTKAFRLTANAANSQLYQQTALMATNQTFSIMVRRVSGTGSIRVYAPDGASFTDITASLTTSFQRFFSPVVNSGGTSFGNILIVTSGDVIEVAFPERDQAGATKYQRVDTATSYDTAGFPLYAAANGTNSTMASATGGGGTLGIFYCDSVAPKGRGTALATPVNAAFSTAVTGGTLAAATYFYRVVAKNAYGKTLGSAETSQITTGTTSTVTVNWGAVSGATGYEVYGRTTGAELLIASVGAVTTYTDDGTITPAGALPGVNSTAYTVLFSDKGANTGYGVILNYLGNLILEAGNGTAYTRATSTDVIALGTPSVPMVWDDGTNLNAQVGSGTVFSVPRPVVVAGTAAFTLWSDNGAATGFFYGNSYPEVYFKDTALTAAQRLQQQNYCKSKAGL